MRESKVEKFHTKDNHTMYIDLSAVQMIILVNNRVEFWINGSQLWLEDVDPAALEKVIAKWETLVNDTDEHINSSGITRVPGGDRMSWRYRIGMKDMGEGFTGFGVVENYEFNNGDTAWSGFLTPWEESPKELLHTLRRILSDLEHDSWPVEIKEK